MSKQPELSELRAMLRAPETGSHNLADYVAAHGAALGLHPETMTGPDEVLAPLLRARLAARREEQRRAAGDDVASRLRRLQGGIYWRGEQVVLPPGLLFRLASSLTGEKYVRFVGDDVDLAVRRDVLQRAGAALRAFSDVSVSIGRAIHLRWGACGRLNLYRQTPEASTAVLIVPLPRRTVFTTTPVLLGDVLAEMGFEP